MYWPGLPNILSVFAPIPSLENAVSNKPFSTPISSSSFSISNAIVRNSLEDCDCGSSGMDVAGSWVVFCRLLESSDDVGFVARDFFRPLGRFFGGSIVESEGGKK